MWRRRWLVVGLAAGLALFATTADAQATRPVVLELFTSQGCPNCPPAERLLPALGGLGLEVVIPLAFHVDYFDSPNWKDRFSRPDWTRRQHAYARLRDATQLSTPQAIIDGGTVVQGADEPAIRAALAAAALRPAARVGLTAHREESRALLEIDIERPAALVRRDLDVVAAIFERGLETPIGSTDKIFRNDYVVRYLDQIGRVEGATGTTGATGAGANPSRLSVRLPLARDWSPRALGVAVFLQDRKTLEILGARAVRLEPPA